MKLNIEKKRSNITIKFTNFCSRNYLAPIKVKLAVLNSCVMSSLWYGSETWGECSFDDFDVIHRLGIKTALSVRTSTCNEIIYLEAGVYPTICTVKKRQLKFWISLCNNLHISSSLYKLIEKAKGINLPYIKYYENLATVYNSPENCERFLRTEFLASVTDKIRNAYTNDSESKLGSYLQVNPELSNPTYDDNIFEIERIHITRFRCGSHNLRIETGRFSNPIIPRAARLCSCGNHIQTLRHILMDCNTIKNAENYEKFRNDFQSVSEYFTWPELHNYMLLISKVLKIDL